ncbi:hypothetical protein O3M35_009381 [Rhynocoris fuscipes]|uniref:Uncharacterized protein n=1 Tax=Rhynocoris fuscipes TaxID=488301 RepID=A0AAW1D3J1_9HEMI
MQANKNDGNKCEKNDKNEVKSKSNETLSENKVEQSSSAASSSDGAWKEVQLQISENGVMSVRNMKTSECSPIPAVEAPNCPVSHPTATSQANSVVATKVSFTSATIRNTEPIVSVSKVSKDQVKKEINHNANDNKLSISRVSSPGTAMPVAKGDVLNRIVSKLSPNETVIGNTGVTIRPVTKVYPGMKSIQERKTRGPSNHVQSRYKTIAQAPTWNPTIDRTTMLTLKQNCDLNKPPRFFKMRNTPRYLGNPAEGVKPMYGGGGRQDDSASKQSSPKSPVKQPPPYTPRGQDKPPPPYTPRPAHTSCGGTYLPPNPYHLLYSGFPFSAASPELIRSMCASTAYHPSLPPSISMLYNNPGLQQSQQRSQPTLPAPHDFKGSPSTPPSIQRIPSSLSPKATPQSIDDKKRDHSPASTSSGSNKSLKSQEDKPSPLLSLPPPPPIPLPPPPSASPSSDKSSTSLTLNNNTKESLLSTSTINHHTLK